MVKIIPNTLRIFSFFLILLISFSQVNSQINQQSASETFKILGLSVEGNESTDAATIIANSGLKVGDEITVPGDATIDAIKRLWKLGIFSDVEILVEKKIKDGIYLQIKVTERERLERAVIEGNDEVDEDDIEEKINLINGQIIKPQEVFNIKQKILSLYEEEGFLNAKVEAHRYEFAKADTLEDEIEVAWRNEEDFSDEYFTTYDYEPESKRNILTRIKNRVILKFNIEEGDEVIVRKILFRGNHAFDDDELAGEFDETSETRWWKFWSSAHLEREKYEEDKQLVVDFYRKNGYRDAEILQDSLVYSNDKKYVDLILDVYEGPQYKIRNIEWEGNTIFSDAELTQRLGFRKGDLYNYEKFEQNLRFNEQQNDVSSLYQDRGFLAFSLETNEKKVAEDSIDIHIKIRENNRFKIGRVDIHGNDKTKDKVIRRELYTVPGDYYSRGRILRSLQELANLEYFNSEKLYKEGITPQPQNDSTVTLNYNVEEKSSDYLNASIGYSGSFGFSGSVGVTLNNFSLSDPFQMGGGQVFNFNWQFGVGNYYRTFNVGFTEPWFMDTPTLVGFDVFDTRQQYIYDLRQSGGTVKVGRRLKWPDNYFYVQSLFRFQYNDVINGRNFYQEGLTRQYTLGFTIRRKDIDNPIFPSKGSKVSLSTEVSGGPFLPGDIDYMKSEFSADWYNRLFNSSRLALYSSVNIGYIKEFETGTPIQPFEYFYMGGNGLVISTTPLRGYEDRSVGPKSVDGTVLGGRVSAKYTTELRAALTLNPMPVYVLAFAEAGNVYLNVFETDFFDLKKSAGIGARLLINPIGLVGFDYGYGFDRRSVDGKDPTWMFHFQFGRGR